MFDNSDRSFLLQVLATTSGDNGRHSTRTDAVDEVQESDTAGLRRAAISVLTKEVGRIAEHTQSQPVAAK